MEVRALGQRGQANLETAKSSNNIDVVQAGNEYPLEKNQSYDNTTSASNSIKEVKEGDIKDALEKVNKFLEEKGTHAEYEVHDKFKDIMIKIVDNKTKEVIQEIPPKKILDMVAKMCELVGVLFDKKA